MGRTARSNTPSFRNGNWIRSFRKGKKSANKASNPERPKSASDSKDFFNLHKLVSQGIIIEDANGMVIQANPSAALIFGLSVEQMRGQPMFGPQICPIFEDGSEIPLDQTLSTRVLQTGNPVYDVTMGIMNPSTGNCRWVLANAIPEFISGEKKPSKVIITFTDISNLKNIIETFSRYETLLNLAMVASNMGIWKLTVSTGSIFLDETTRSHFGLGEGQFSYKEILKRIHPDDQARVLEEVLSHIAKKDHEPAHIEFRVIHPDGSIRWLTVYSIIQFINTDSGAIPVTAVGTSHDITERKLVEEELVKANRNYELISTYSNDVIWVLDVKTEKCTFVSPSVKKLRGFTVEEALQQTLTDILTPESYQKAKMLLLNNTIDIIEGRSSISYSAELDQIRKDGSTVATEVTSSQFYDDEGNIQVIGISRDITERKHAEATLREERNLFQVLMDNIPDAIYFKDLKSRFIRINKAEAEIFGIKEPSQAIGKTDIDFFAREHANQALKDERKIIETGQPLIDFEEKETFPDGHIRWISTSKLPFRNSSGKIVGTFGISHDITKRKEMELLLEGRIKELETVYEISNLLRSAESVQELIQILLRETLKLIDSKDGSIFLFEPETNKLVLYEAFGWFEQLAGLTIACNEGINGLVFSTNQPYITHDFHNDPNLLQRVKHLIVEGQSGGFFPIQCSEGILGVIDIFVPSTRVFNGNELRLLSIISQMAGNAILRSRLTEKLKQTNLNLQEEINQRIEYQSMLAAEKELLSTTLMSIGEGVIITDRDELIILFNQSAEQITGFDTSEIIDRPLKDVFRLIDPATQDIVPDLTSTLFAMSLAQERGLNYKAPLLLTKSGERIVVTGSINTLKSPEGEMIGHVIVFQDITEKQKTEAQTALSQKMEAIGQLAAGIAHEINTPIQYVGDNLRFLEKTVLRFAEVHAAYRSVISETSPEENCVQRDRLNEIEKRTKINHYINESPNAVKEALDGVERVRKIVLAMREFSHPSEKEKKLADINHGIETTVVISRNEWKYFTDLETELDPALPPVYCQIDEINQVILNMIINAVQAVQDKFPTGSEKKGKIVIKTNNFGDHIEIKIQDNGKGIPEGIKTRIFDPFFTTKGVGKGTGQGLSLAHQIIVQKHQGKIFVDSIEGEGATFTIEIPIGATEKETKW